MSTESDILALLNEAQTIIAKRKGVAISECKFKTHMSGVYTLEVSGEVVHAFFNHEDLIKWLRNKEYLNVGE